MDCALPMPATAITLELPAGTTCLLGPAGAGKSRLMRAMCGLAPDINHITLPPGQHRQALLAQDGGLFPHATVADSVQSAMATRGIPPRDRPRKLAALIEEFALPAAARCGSLDPDTMLRARLAAALASEPTLLLLDDPLAACNDRTAMIEVLREARQRRRLTVIHATRRREEAFALADHLVLMDCGQVLQSGSAAALYEAPASLFIAARLGAANILPGHIEDIEDDIAYVRLECGPVIETNPPAQDVTVPAGGVACQVLLRPERISVSAIAAAELGGAAVPAILRHITHMGDALRLGVAIGTDTELTIIRPAALGTLGLTAGRSVSIAWQSRHALTFLAVQSIQPP